MAERLGNVIYWTCTVAAVLWTGLALYAPSTQQRPEWGVGVGIAAVIAVPLWLIGRAVRYVLTGR
jgi:hypothetical protein